MRSRDELLQKGLLILSQSVAQRKVILFIYQRMNCYIVHTKQTVLSQLENVSLVWILALLILFTFEHWKFPDWPLNGNLFEPLT